MAAPLERKLRDELLRFSKLCYERHLLVALDGNLSARLSDELVLCTRAGCHKGLLADDDLVVVDRAGKLVRGGGRPTSEMAMHLCCYDSRPDIQAVIHAHPPYATSFAVSGKRLDALLLPETTLFDGPVGRVAFIKPGSDRLAAAVAKALLIFE